MLELVINTTANTPSYYQNITDGAGKWIGELYQDQLFDRETGEYVGINQGYAFNFDDGNEVNNNIMFMEGSQDQLYWTGNAVISASGNFSKYQGGSVSLDVIQGDPDYITIVTLSEPTPRVEEDSTSSSHGQDSLKLNITHKGSSATPITSDGVPIGAVFHSLVRSLDNSSNIIGQTKGHSFIFPQDNFTSDVLGLSLNDHARAVGIQYIYLEGDNDDGTLTLIDENVVHATGSLLKYDGGKVSEWNIISTDPYVAEATISSAKDANNQEEDDVVGPSNFRFTSEDGFWEPMLIGENETMLGERFRDSVYDMETNTRIGTNSGFAFTFPTTLLPRWANPYIAIRNVYLDGGSIDILNQVVVGASGAYKSYVGWIYDETIVSYNPVFTADIKLLDPSAETETGASAPSPSSSIEEGNGGNTAEVTIDELNGKIASTAAPPGFNIDGTSVFTNFVNAVNDRQFFLLRTGSNVYEKPGTEPVQLTFLHWCSDLTFSSDLSNSSLMGLAGRCVYMVLAGYAEALSSGATIPYKDAEGQFTATMGISAVFVEQLNVFEDQFHSNTDDFVFRCWDDGRKVMPMIGWEGHDEGDTSPNAATASWSAFGEVTWMHVEEVAQLLNKSVDEFTPDKFKQVYLDAWIKGHEQEAAEKNPNSGAEQEIIEEVKNETSPTDETVTPPAQPVSTEGDEGGVTDPTTTNPVDDSGSGRKLTSIVAKFVALAGLGIFGI